MSASPCGESTAHDQEISCPLRRSDRARQLGQSGTPANERRYSDHRLREAFYTAREIAQLMDELGFDVLWTAEHHFQREGYEVFPNLIALGLWLATQTRRLKFGCAFNILRL
jgi:alkanesulfonate monooxygenase SsuD/methylene tetrahydromethanopterin reductase-like flavin-dependent oxidoreductase (luciferase family)